MVNRMDLSIFKGFTRLFFQTKVFLPMNILVLNCGSSSIKFQLFKMPDEVLLTQGKAEKNESGNTRFLMKVSGKNRKFQFTGFSYQENLNRILQELVRPSNNCLHALNELDVVGHRLIHSGDKNETKNVTVITPEVIAYMESCTLLAPLHYPANLEGIRTIGKLLPEVIQAGVFDTAFHTTLPPRAFLYGIPLHWYLNHGIRRHGFHGTSHKYAVQQTCKIAGLPLENSKIVSCHLGNGASLAAVKNGQSVDTSMGLTPVEGLLMGTRCGDIDAGVLVYLHENFNLSVSEIQKLVNNEGGLLGLSGISSDFRAVEEAARKKHKAAQTALDVYCYRVKKYIGAYAAAMGGIDALVFTGGVGENSVYARAEICSGLEFLGIRISQKLNAENNGSETVLNQPGAKVKIVIVPANEELMIAREVAGWIKNKRPGIFQ